MDAPKFLYLNREDSLVIMRLYPASEKNGPISHYYVIVVPYNESDRRLPDDFDVDEVRIWPVGFTEFLNLFLTSKSDWFFHFSWIFCPNVWNTLNQRCSVGWCRPGWKIWNFFGKFCSSSLENSMMSKKYKQKSQLLARMFRSLSCS